jgi:glycosyltransferase involved in cell wall biosynthesis
MKRSFKISGVVIAKNEEAAIGNCISSLHKVCDEVIVVDSFSTDQTVQIAKDLGARVFQKKWKGYSATKNEANALASHAYILSLDADEVLSDELILSIKGLNGHSGAAFQTNRLNQFNGKWMRHGGWYPDQKIRLFPNEAARWEGDFVHETLIVKDEIPIVQLKGDILHYSADTLSTFELKNEKYARLKALERFESGDNWNYLVCLIGAGLDWFKRIVLKQGWRDGANGFAIATMNAKLKMKRYHYFQEMKKKVAP